MNIACLPDSAPTARHTRLVLGFEGPPAHSAYPAIVPGSLRRALRAETCAIASMRCARTDLPVGTRDARGGRCAGRQGARTESGGVYGAWRVVACSRAAPTLPRLYRRAATVCAASYLGRSTGRPP